ncbi:MAG TPA: hypothetical protein VKR27_08230, partial [Acidimicrobiales bacterium]|nr:hypothetical protein [Acidimicrobiales bacterium]
MQRHLAIWISEPPRVDTGLADSWPSGRCSAERCKVQCNAARPGDGLSLICVSREPIATLFADFDSIYGTQRLTGVLQTKVNERLEVVRDYQAGEITRSLPIQRQVNAPTSE